MPRKSSLMIFLAGSESEKADGNTGTLAAQTTQYKGDKLMTRL